MIRVFPSDVNHRMGSDLLEFLQTFFVISPRCNLFTVFLKLLPSFFIVLLHYAILRSSNHEVVLSEHDNKRNYYHSVS